MEEEKSARVPQGRPQQELDHFFIFGHSLVIVSDASVASMHEKGFALSDNPKGPKIEKNQSRLNFSISLENFNLD